jgi:hypothetical protein
MTVLFNCVCPNWYVHNMHLCMTTWRCDVCDCLRLRVSVRFAFWKTLFSIALFSLSLSAPQQS